MSGVSVAKLGSSKSPGVLFRPSSEWFEYLVAKLGSSKRPSVLSALFLGRINAASEKNPYFALYGIQTFSASLCCKNTK